MLSGSIQALNGLDDAQKPKGGPSPLPNFIRISSGHTLTVNNQKSHLTRYLHILWSDQSGIYKLASIYNFETI